MIILKVILLYPLIAPILGVILNINVDKHIDLTTQIVKIKEIITFQNGYTGNISTYSYVLNESSYTLVDFYQGGTKLQYDEIKHKDTNYKEFIMKLKNSVQPRKTSKLIIHLIQINHVKLLNKKRKVNENQLFQYYGNIYVYSKYHTKNYQCVVNVVTPVIEVSEKFHENHNGISFKMIEVRAYSFKNFTIIYVNNAPMYIVNNLQRTIDVSHYGRIFVEDKVKLTNAASLVLAPYDPFQTKRTWFHCHLPASSKDIQFYDILGNNSKTEISLFPDFKTLRFQLRYPLLGGWKGDYILQYNLPTYEYLTTNYNGNFKLEMRVIDHILNDVIIEEASVRIILPEGSRIDQINIPEEFYKKNHELSFTSLVFTGRPTVKFNGNMLTEYHILPFTVYYDLSSIYLYRVPLILAAYIQIAFLIVIVLRYYKF